MGFRRNTGALPLLAKNLQRLLGGTKITQKELARRIGLTATSITHLLKQTNKNPGIESLIAIADEFDVPVAYLFTDHRVTPDHNLEECWRRIKAKVDIDLAQLASPSSHTTNDQSSQGENK